jgi:hypothetical protein
LGTSLLVELFSLSDPYLYGRSPPPVYLFLFRASAIATREPALRRTLLYIAFYSKLSEGAELILDLRKCIGLDDQKLAFGDYQCAGGYVAGNKKLGPDTPAGSLDVAALETCDVLESPSGTR